MFNHKLTQSVFIINGARTIIGSPFKSLKNFTAAQLGAEVLREILNRNHIKKILVNEVILGNAVAAGIGQNLARQATLLAGLPESVPAFTVNNVCGAGLQSVILGAQSIQCGDSSLVIAGGAESATHCPDLVPKNKDGHAETRNSLDSLQQDGLFCQLSKKNMGQLAEFIVKKYDISREEQDQYALESHQKACRAIEQGKFKPEIIPIVTSGGKLIDEDDRPRCNIQLKPFTELPAAFKKDGTVTVGNSSTPCDGAGAVILASQRFIKEERIKPKARILGYATIALEPEMVFEAGIRAIEECLKKIRLTIKDIELFELSEAFAAQSILTIKNFNIPPEKVNVWGGDIALGHPLGAAGTRILVTLLHALTDQKKKRGLACICLGGGGAVCMIIERIK